jgi:threonylcarbamoyladenosine tRNA methylthiotransferase MtaB
VCTVRIETLGCRLNQIESESAAQLFIESGFNVIFSINDADDQTRLVIINTCAVTQKAEQKARRIFRLALKNYKNAVVLITGCYAQLSKAQIENMDNRIAVLGGQIKSRIAKLPDLLKNNTLSPADFAALVKNELCNIPAIKPGFPEDSFKFAASSLQAHSRASLKIQDGCNNNCSFCTIHIARGHSVSLDVKSALERVHALENQGYDEVVLTTINIAQYKGLFIDSNGVEQYFDFAALLKYLLESTQKINFRISSLYPEIVNDDFCKVIKNPRVRPHFHISVQSGSNKILQLMNRKYNRDDVLNACKNLRAAKPDCFLACDIITGFPDESDEDFEQTMDLCRQCDFTWVHTFPFSPRPGTPAFNMKPKIPQALSQERAHKLNDWAVEQKSAYIKSFIGKPLPAIIEKQQHVSTPETFIYNCMTQNFIHCQVSSLTSLQESKEYKITITDVILENIHKGGEIEATALVEV